MTTHTPGALIERYRALRDKKAALKKELEAAIKPYDDALEMIENVLLSQMNEQNVNSFKADTGTAFKKIEMSVRTADKDVLMDFVKENDCFDMLTAAISKDALKEYLEANEDKPPPGVDVTFKTIVQVRKPS